MHACAQVPTAVEELLGGKWAQEDLLPLNGSAQEVHVLRERMLLARAAAKARKGVKRAPAGTSAGKLLAGTAVVAAANDSGAGAGASSLMDTRCGMQPALKLCMSGSSQL